MRRPGNLGNLDNFWFSGFGAEQTVEEIDKKIEIYNKHIADLKKIIMVGSKKGKEAAKIKLVDVESKLKELHKLRDEAIAKG